MRVKSGAPLAVLRKPDGVRAEVVEEPVLTINPIGIIRNEMIRKFDAPHQPVREAASSSVSSSVIELYPQRDFHKALEDLEGFSHIWLLWWFHRNASWKPKVRPPRGDETKRGLFATRSPHRPNPIGISAVRLLGVSGRTVTVGSCDLLDGTPILDIKPYIPAVDSFPDSRTGWLEGVEEQFAQPPAYQVAFKERAAEQLAWLQARGINFIERAVAILERDPSPNRTRRIRRWNPELFRMGCAEWRVFFSLSAQQVTIEHVQPGYPFKLLKSPGHTVIADRDAQLAFAEKWPIL